jgi:hypothetical protein
MTVKVADAQPHIERLDLVVKMATVREGCATGKKLSVEECRLLGCGAL